MNNMNTASPALIYLHVPKCGGTTLASAIESLYPERNTFKVSRVVRKKLGDSWMNMPSREREQYALSVLRDMPEAERLKLRLLTGHMVFGMHEYLPQGARYITMLRHPEKLVPSLYRYILDLPRHPHKEAIQKQEMSVADFAESGLNYATDNVAVRRISGIGESVPFGNCTAAHLDLAKTNLDTYFAVAGIMERFDESLLLMRATLGWTRQPYYVTRNVSSAKIEKNQLGEKELDRIRALNWADLQLFQYVTERLERQIQALGPTFGEQVQKFKTDNQRHSRWRVGGIKHAVKRALGSLKAR